jgi:peptide/nickel transport system permease protein
LAQVAPEVGERPSEVFEGEGAIKGKSPGQLFWARFRQDKLAFIGLFFIIVMVLVAIFAGVITSNILEHGPNQVFVRETLDDFGLPEGPQSGFYFGADEAGRDVFARVLHGARTSLTVAIVATGISLVIGVTVGLVAGFYRGKTDTFLSRVTDVVIALPVLLLSLGLVASCSGGSGCLQNVPIVRLFFSPGIWLVSFVIGFFNWPYISRIVRGQVLSLREKEFIEAARAQGAGNLRIIAREVLPNVVAPIIVYSTLIIPNNILFEASLSYLGAGVPLETPSWGKMLADAQGVFVVAPWLMIFPGLFLFITTLSFNLLGDGLRDALDPRTAR